MPNETYGLSGLSSLSEMEQKIELERRKTENERTSEHIEKSLDFLIDTVLDYTPFVGPGIRNAYDWAREEGLHLFTPPPGSTDIKIPDDAAKVGACLNDKQYQILNYYFQQVGLSKEDAQLLISDSAQKYSDDLIKLGERITKIDEWTKKNKKADENHEKPVNDKEDLKNLVQVIQISGQIASALGCKPIAQGAVILSSAITLYNAGASIFAGIAAGAGIGSMLGPIGAIGGALFGIVKLFLGGGPDPTVIILQQLKHVSQQIVDLNNNMRSYFEAEYKMQKIIIDTIVEGFKQINKQLKNEIGSLREEFRDSLNSIKESIEFIERLTQQTGKEILIKDFTEVTANADQWLHLNFDGDPEQRIPQISNQLSIWAIVHSTNKLLNGIGLWDLQPKIQDSKNLVTDNMTDNKINYLIGYFACYAQERRKDQYSTDNSSFLNFDLAKLPNPFIWHLSVLKYIEFKREFICLDNDPNFEQLELIKNVGQSVLNFIDQIKSDKKFWQVILDDYYNTVSSLDKTIKLLSQHQSNLWINGYNTNYLRHENEKNEAYQLTKQTSVGEFDFLTGDVSAFIKQFDQRSINELTGGVDTLNPGPPLIMENMHVEGVNLIGLDSKILSKKRIYNSLAYQHVISSELLCAEFLGLAHIKAYQLEQLQGLRWLHIGAVVPSVKKKSRVDRDLVVEYFDYPEVDGKDGVGDGAPPIPLEIIPSINLIDQSWSLKIQIKASLNGSESPLNIITYSKDWRDMPAVHAECWTHEKADGHERMAYITYGFPGGTERDKYANGHITKILDIFNSDQNIDLNIISLNDISSKTKLAINQHIIKKRQDIASFFLKKQDVDTDSQKLVNDFYHQLEMLDFCGEMLQWYAYICGKNIKDSSLDKILTSKNIIDDLTRYNNSNPTNLNITDPIVSSLQSILQQNKMTYESIMNLPDYANPKNSESKYPELHPRNLLEMGIQRLSMYQVWNKIYKIIFPMFSHYTNLNEYQAQRAKLYQRIAFEEVYQYLETLYKVPFLEARESTAPNEVIDPSPSDYQKYYEIIDRWAIHRSRDDVVTGYSEVINKLVNISNLGDLPTQEMLLLKLNRGWTSNIYILNEIAKKYGDCKFDNKETLINFTMWYDGLSAFLNIVNNTKFSNSVMGLLNLTQFSDKPIEKVGQELKIIEIHIVKLSELLSAGNELHDVIVNIGLNSNLFDKLFQDYIKTIKFIQDFVSDKIQQGIKNIDIDKQLETLYIGTTEKAYDQMEIYQLVITSFVNMLFGYDIQYLPEFNQPFSNFKSKDQLRKYLHEDTEDKYKDLNIELRLKIYIDQITEIKDKIVKRISYAMDLKLFCDYLQNYFKTYNITKNLIIDGDKFNYALTHDKIILLDNFLEQTNTIITEISLDNINLDDVQILNDLLSLLSKHSHINTIRLRQANLNTQSYALLLKWLPSLVNLTEIDLSNNNLGSQGVSDWFQLANLLQAMPYLTTIRLANNQLNDGLLFIIAALSNHNQLKIIDLSDNPLTSGTTDMVSAFKELLLKHPTLEAVSLANLKLSVDDLIPIIDNSLKIENIKSLDLSGNFQGHSTIQWLKLINFLQVLPKLSQLCLSNAQVGDDEFRILIALAQQQPIKVFDFHKNNISSQVVTEIASIIDKLSLQIYFSGNNIDEAIIKKYIPISDLAIRTGAVPQIGLSVNLYLGQPLLDLGLRTIQLNIKDLEQRHNIKKAELELLKLSNERPSLESSRLRPLMDAGISFYPAVPKDAPKNRTNDGISNRSLTEKKSTNNMFMNP